uniref:Uncharacterized protein n=1 Tax=Populus trichocarpa TaxID=3694 RepID=B9GLU6_POPTR
MAPPSEERQDSISFPRNHDSEIPPVQRIVSSQASIETVYRDEERHELTSANASKLTHRELDKHAKKCGEDAAEREEEALEEGRKSLISNMEIPGLQSRMERI